MNNSSIKNGLEAIISRIERKSRIVFGSESRNMLAKETNINVKRLGQIIRNEVSITKKEMIDIANYFDIEIMDFYTDIACTKCVVAQREAANQVLMLNEAKHGFSFQKSEQPLDKEQ